MGGEGGLLQKGGSSDGGAGTEEPLSLQGPIEILTLAGTVSDTASHLHATLSLADGRVLGGHVAPGCMVRTTVEVLLAVLPEWEFVRMMDAATGYKELVIRRKASGEDDKRPR